MARDCRWLVLELAALLVSRGRGLRGSVTLPQKLSAPVLVAGGAEDFFLQIGDTGVELGVLHAAQLRFD